MQLTLISNLQQMVALDAARCRWIWYRSLERVRLGRCRLRLTSVPHPHQAVTRPKRSPHHSFNFRDMCCSYASLYTVRSKNKRDAREVRNRCSGYNPDALGALQSCLTRSSCGYVRRLAKLHQSGPLPLRESCC